MWLFIYSNKRFEKTCGNFHLRKPHTLNYCDFESVQSGDLRRHLKIILWKISHFCNYCEFTSVQAGYLRAHLKTHIWENHTHATIVTLHLFKQAIREDMWKLTFRKMEDMQLMWLCICSSRRFEKTFEDNLMEKFRISAIILTLHLFKQAIWEDIWKSFYGEISHICNYCEFTSVQAGY